MPPVFGKETKKTLKTLATRTIMPPVFGERNQKDSKNPRHTYNHAPSFWGKKPKRL